MSKPSTLSATARAVLAAAAARGDRLAQPPDHLPAAAQRAVVQSLLKAGLLDEIAADDDQPAWRTVEGDARLALRITGAGLRAVGVEPATPQSADPSATAQGGPLAPDTASDAPHRLSPSPAATDAPTTPPQATGRMALRSAAQAVLAAWDDLADGRPALPRAVDALRAAVAASAPRAVRAVSGTPRPPRAGTKQSAVLALLRRPEGASGPQLIEATGWAPHTVRGFLAGLARKGIAVAVLDRVRQVGPDKQGARGSYTVYRIAGAG